MLFTNGTGTGKTYLGLGTIKRLSLQGKNNILIVAPDTKIASDWIDAGVNLGLKITPLASTKDAGKGIVITTYANLGENDQLVTRSWDMVVSDEIHSLMQASTGDPTSYLHNMRAITYHPQGATVRYEMLNREEIAKRDDLDDKIEFAIKHGTNGEALNKMRAEHRALSDKLRAAQKAVREDVDSKQGAGRTRLLGLSASPFAYEKTIDWANGYMFDYKDGYPYNENDLQRNQPNPRQYYFMTRFGYSIRYGKLTEPNGIMVDRGMLQRQWNTEIKKSGALAGRMLDVVPDYDRRFVTVKSAIGNKIDEAMEWMNTKTADMREAQKDVKREDQDVGYATLRDEIAGKFKYLEKRYILEAIKASEVIPIIRQHLALNRKIVVFHDYKKGGAENPFDLQPRSTFAVDLRGTKENQEMQQRFLTAAINFNRVLSEFKLTFPELIHGLNDMESPIEVFKRELPEAMLINGDEKKSDLLKRYKLFQDDDSGPMVMLVQSAKNKGWSGHDTTGKNQRVLINLGQPTAPTLTIQTEGRIYRTGQASDAIMRYLNTGTNWERWTFATTIATRASTAENLGMGESARALKDSFIESFEESDEYPPGHDGEGKGGKERDKAANNVLTEYDRAKTHYWATMKKNARTKSEEGTDYFATPEPVGLKMTQWLDARPGEDTLEPSGGHGAIARWLPDSTKRTVIEPSPALMSRLSLVMNPVEDRLIPGTFEDLAVNNKYDGIAMNPPFGSGGRTAIDHLAKAATHLRDGGRIVALIPTGPAADAKFDKWFHGTVETLVKPLIDHPTFGAIYRGDTVTTDSAKYPTAKVVKINEHGSFVLHFPGDAQDFTLTPSAVMSVAPTGKRTELSSPTSSLYMVASIKLPGVTFERAATGAMTRIVVLERQEKSGVNGQQVNLDLTHITDINKLFDTLEHLDFGKREVAEAPEQPAASVPSNTQAKTPKAATAKLSIGDSVTIGGNQYHLSLFTTAAGKSKHGVWMDKEEASKFSTRSFQSGKNRGTPNEGKFFVDEFWFPKGTKADDAGPVFNDIPRVPIAREVVQDEFNTSEKKRGMRSLTDDIGPGQTVAAVKAQISKVATAIPGITVEVVQSASDLPENAAPGDTEGVWYEGTKVYLVADNLENAQRAEQVLAHEAIGHAALEALLGPKLMSDLIRNVKNLEALGNKVITAIVAQVDKTQPGLSPARRAKEIVAVMAEQGQHKGMWNRIVAAVQGYLRKAGFKVDFNEQDIRAMLRDAENLVAKPRNRETANAAVTGASNAEPAYSRKFGQYGDLDPDQLLAVTNVIGVPKTTIERAKEFGKDWRKSTVQGIFDQYSPIKDYSMKGYIQARMSKGSSSTLEAIFMYGKPYIDQNGDITGQFDSANGGKNGFASVLAKLDGEHDRFLLWVAATRAERLKGIGLENLFQDEDIDALKTTNLGQLQNGRDRATAYTEALREMMSYNNAIMDIAVQRGLINAETRKMFQDMPYVPFYRLMDEGVVPGFIAQAGLVNQYAWKKLTGGTEKLNEDLLANTLKNWSHIIEASARNEAAKTTLEAGIVHGAAQEVPSGRPGRDIVYFRDNVTTELKLTDPVTGTYTRVEKYVPKGETYKDSQGVEQVSDGTAQVVVNVERAFIVTDPHLLDAITSISNSYQVPKMWRDAKQMLTTTVTINPAFKLRNLIRDSIQSVVLDELSYNPIKNAAKGIALTHINSETRAKMLFSGGMIRFGSMLDGNSANMARELVTNGIPKEHILDNAGKIEGMWRHYIKPAFDAYQELGDRSEQINRATLYEILTRPVADGGKGMTHGEASFWARDLMDFSMSGKWKAIRMLTQTVPFMNARLQGTYKLGKSAAKNKARTAIILSAVVMASLALLAMYHDDDDWKKREDWDRDNYWWFKIGGIAFRMPKPFEIGMIGTMAERLAELAFDKEMTGKRFKDRMIDLVMQQMSMNPVPQLIKPLAEIYANKSFFTDRPIESKGMENLQAQDRFTDNTSGTARLLGSLGLPNPVDWGHKLSPVQIDSLIRGYFSWVGTGITTALDYGIFHPLENKGAAVPMKLKDVFFAGNFMESLPSGSSRYVSQLYAQAAEIEQAYGSYRRALESGDHAKADAMMKTEGDKIKQGPVVRSLISGESELSKQIIRVRNDKGMTSEAKAREIDRLNKQKDTIARTFHPG